MSIKKSFIIIFMFSLLFGSSLFVNAKETKNLEFTTIVNRFLPNNAQSMAPEQPPSAQSIQPYDFDKDGQDELVVTFKIPGEPGQPKVMLLKKENERWEKVWETTGEGHDIDYSGFVDITGDGTKEYMIGWMIGASAGNLLEIYEWQNQSLRKIADYSFYHILEVLQEGSQTSLAIWDRFCCDAYIVNVLRWDGTKLVLDEKMYAQYYPKIEDFYKSKMKEMDAWFYWYALADAQIKAGLLEEAERSIQKGFSFNNANEEFQKLQKKLDEKSK